MKDGVRTKRGKDILAERRRLSGTHVTASSRMVITPSPELRITGRDAGVECVSHDTGSSDSGSCD